MSYIAIGSEGSIKHRRKTKKGPRAKTGIVYVIRFVRGSGEVIWKIGFTTRKITSRLIENMLGYYNVYGYMPMATVLCSKRTEYYKEVEQMLLREFADRYMFDKPFGGSSEYRIVDEGELVKRYDVVMANPLEFVTPLADSMPVVLPQDSYVDIADYVPEMVGVDDEVEFI